MNVEKVLRKTAVEIRGQNINGWGNACEAGADRIRELEIEQRRIRRLESALRHVRASAQGKENGVVISYAAFEKVRAALTANDGQAEQAGQPNSEIRRTW